MLITPELLRELIPLPISTDIIGSLVNAEYVDVVVDDPALPETSGEELPIVTPTFRRNVPVEFVDWGVK
jgi:hypothetical protein